MVWELVFMLGSILTTETAERVFQMEYTPRTKTYKQEPRDMFGGLKGLVEAGCKHSWSGIKSQRQRIINSLPTFSTPAPTYPNLPGEEAGGSAQVVESLPSNCWRPSVQPQFKKKNLVMESSLYRAPLVEHLQSKSKPLSSNLSTTKNKINYNFKKADTGVLCL
jgi:hypothetical protein